MMFNCNICFLQKKLIYCDHTLWCNLCTAKVVLIIIVSSYVWYGGNCMGMPGLANLVQLKSFKLVKFALANCRLNLHRALLGSVHV